MFDFSQSRDLVTLIARFYETGRVVATVCHGAAGLLNVTLSEGEPLVRGKRVSGFSWPKRNRRTGRRRSPPTARRS
jgi:putative intracellular protease/amidase